jgi:hypothetical protein
MDNTIKRRLFIRGAVATAALLCLKKLPASEMYVKDHLDKEYFINPAYSAYKTATGELVLETGLPGGKIQFFKYQGLEMDILQLISEKKSVLQSISQLADKFHTTHDSVLSRSTLFIERLYKEGIIINKDSKIIIVQNVVRNASNE